MCRDRFEHSRRRRAARRSQAPVWLAVFLLVSTSGCAMVRLHRDLVEVRRLGLLSGPVVTPGGDTDQVVVALFRSTAEGSVLEDADRLTSTVDSYAFLVEAQQPYLLVAFQDHDGDLLPGASEPAAVVGHPRAIVVTPGQHLDQDIRLAADAAAPPGIDLSGLQDAAFDVIPIAAGELATLDDPRFSPEQAKAGMWSPLAAIREVGGGVFFLEPYDPRRIPVLFVHGIGGTPRDFAHLVEDLDKTRFQAWIYHYPSGVRLERAGELLARLTVALRRELGFDRLFLAAHSMGGLVARSFVQQLAAGGRHPVELFVTFSTPWNGHKGAAQGVKYAPVVMPSWIDMKPGSTFLHGLRVDLDQEPTHHLFFGFQTNRNPLMLFSHDSVIAVASQLDPWFQERAERIYGFDLDHVGILRDEQVAQSFHRILARASRSRE